MNRRVEMLKGIARFGKKYKLPKQLITIVLVVVLMLMYMISFIIMLPKRVISFLFPNRNIILNYSALLMIVMIMITFVIKISGLESFVYGDSAYNSSSETINHVPLDSDKQPSHTAGELQTDEHSTGELSNPNSNGLLGEEPASAGELWYLNVATSGELVDGHLTEEHINKMSFYIKVNRLRNCITVYIQDENGEYTVPVKAMRCSAGGENTPLGVYKTNQKYDFRKLLFNVYGQYATRIVGQILFHSSSYEAAAKDTLIAEEFNKLGDPVSHGCIRLTTEDAKWIYDYCKLGTTVEIYEDEDPGPLGIPEVIKIPEDSVWDPTDPAEENPWNDKKPEICGENNIYVTQGHEVDFLESITAVDTCGNDITKNIKVTGSVNHNVIGTYSVTYSVTDILGRSAQKTVTYIVR